MDTYSTNGALPQLNLYERLLQKYELMQSVFSIISRKDLSFAQMIDGILLEGCELFDEDVGIVSEIKRDKYVVRHVYTVDNSIDEGQVYAVNDTICSIALEAKGPVGIADIQDSEWKKHPCTKRGLKSYIGVPITIEERIFGTLSFSSSRVKGSPFQDIDIEFVETLGDWVSMILARSIMLDELHILATHDSLTGLPNRKYFQKRLDSCIHRSRRDKHYSFALLFIDVDRFKEVNDQFGHYAGDATLKEVALRVEAHVRPRDNIGRFAGDEFLVLIEDIGDDQVMTIAQRIHESVKKPIHVDEKTVHIETSIGITMSGNADDAKGLIDIADKAMYKAKRQNKCLCLLTRSKQIYK